MNELELILENAHLRDELEPFLDESLLAIDLNQMSTQIENQYLTSLLAWERAPVLPISQWFEPELKMTAPQHLDDEQMRLQLHQVIGQLFQKNILLECTEHLSDRQLYCLILRDILPAQEKRVGLDDSIIRWQCLDPVEDEESWLRYYASTGEREQWADETGLRLPPKQELPFPRIMPQQRTPDLR